jgi:hypothetical protein
MIETRDYILNTKTGNKNWKPITFPIYALIFPLKNSAV